MCGIVGYIGNNDPQKVIIDGLRRLEYRGYDSSGIALSDGKKFSRCRAEGKLSQLESALLGKPVSGHVGIGHTRWATHGAPSERNAHPHSVGDVVIVHNGIIENFREIKERLQAEGVEFLSDTDSEVIAHLLNRELSTKKTSKTLHQAVENILPQLSGAFSVLAMWLLEPEVMVAFKNGPPLVIGVGKGEMIVASDIQALIEYTREVIYLNDDEIAILRINSLQLFGASGAPIERSSQTIDWAADSADKMGYSHYMLKEIYEQPRALAQAVQPYIDLKTRSFVANQLDFSALKNRKRIFIVACGTSYYAGLYGKYMIEKLARVPVELDIASEFRYRSPLIQSTDLFISVSQSGETADTLAAVRLARSVGAKCLSICNSRQSSIERESDMLMSMNCGPEIGVASTKAFMSSLGCFAVLAALVAKADGQMTQTLEQELVDALLAAPSHIENVLNFDKFFNEAAESLKHYRGFLYMGRGASYPIALEGALKMKELAYLHAEGYAAGEMKHGPLALIDERMCVVMLTPNDELYDKTMSNLEEVRARKGSLIVLGNNAADPVKDNVLHYLSLPQSHWLTSPMLLTVPLQLMSFHLAESLGHNVDQPRNLAKSVTVE